MTLAPVSHDLPWYVYMLRCSDDTFYIGIARSIEKRMAMHTAGKGARYTRGRAPFTLVYSESHGDKSGALKREAALKKLTRAQKQALLPKRTSRAKAKKQTRKKNS